MKIPNLVNFENWSSISAWSCRLSLAPSLPIKASASPSPTYLVCYFKQHNPLPPLRSPRSLLSPFSSLLPPPLSSQSRSLPLPPLLSPLFSSRKPPPPENDYLCFFLFSHLSHWIYIYLDLSDFDPTSPFSPEATSPSPSRHSLTTHFSSESSKHYWLCFETLHSTS